MDDLKEINEALEKHASRVKEIGDEIRTQVESESAEAKARLDELTKEQARITEEVAPLLADKEKAEAKATAETTQKQLEALFREVRSPSKASAAMGQWSNDPTYQAGSFLSSIVDLHSGDPDAFHAAKATLEGMTRWEAPWGKATLGNTDATGGWIVPNAIVEDIIKPKVQQDPYRRLVTVREGVTAFQIDLPTRLAAPARMVVAARGATKENVDLVYNGYTATMYTLARIHDVANQFLKQSAGAAEADVLEELANAATLGERYYIMEGSGSSEPYGIATALTNSAYNDEITHTPATTLAGSVAAAINIGAENLATRSVVPNAAVVHPSVYWLALRQGDDQAGFYFPQAFNGQDPFTDPVRIWGIPLIFDANLAGTDDLIVGDFKSVKVFFGDTFRIDSSSVAGTRWDENETGFRGEFEMGLDARPAVYTGNFTRSTDVTP